jgi:histidinol-phosphate phosphatase family protein
MKRAIFLDRDGTIIVDKGYLSDPDDIVFERDAVAGLRAMAGLGFLLVVVSNQSGAGRGLFPRTAVDAVNGRLSEMLQHEGVAPAGFYICPHAPDAGCHCRKPQPGLVLQAAAELDLDIATSFVIGDKPSDLLLARNAGATGILVTTGQGAEAQGWARENGFAVCTSLCDAVGSIRRA